MRVRAHDGPARGFTLVELVVVLLLAAVLVSLAVPRLTDRRALDERAAGDRVRSLLNQARSLAIAQQREVCVLVGVPQVRVVYVNAGACAPAQAVAGPGGQGPLVADMPNAVAVSTTAAGGRIRFNAAGQPVPALDVTVRIGTRVLTVYRETGAVL